MPIRCEIVSQDRLVFEGEADIVIVPGSLGEMGIMPGHAPLLSTLELGVIRVKSGELEDVFTVTGGFIEVQPDIVTIMADAAENVEDIDVKRAEEAMSAETVNIEIKNSSAVQKTWSTVPTPRDGQIRRLGSIWRYFRKNSESI